MDWQPWLATATTLGAVIGLVRGGTPCVWLLGAAGLLVVLGVVPSAEALACLGNPAVIATGLLLMVAAGVEQSGALGGLVGLVLGRGGERASLARLSLPVAGLSGFMNNTPLVAMLLGPVHAWARERGQSPSLYLLPLSYAAVLGGLITLIGTSTNLVVDGLLRQSGHPGLSLFTITPVGLPVALVGLAAVLLLAPRLLPRRQGSLGRDDASLRTYVAEALVDAGGPLVGLSLATSGLRHLPEAYLVEVIRAGTPIPAVHPELVLEGGDRLVFAGAAMALGGVMARAGLCLALDHAYTGAGRVLIEAVVAPGGSLPGCAVNEAGFRVRLNAALVAIGRHDQALGALGERRLAAGDLLLLETLPDYVESLQRSPDLHVLAVASRRGRRSAWMAPLVLVGVVTALATGVLDLVQATAAGALLLLISGVLPAREAARALQPGLLGSILGALVLGLALERSGAAASVAQAVLGVVGDSPRATLIGVYLITLFATELLTNNAAAALILPFALVTAERLGCSPMPFAVAVMMAASASFLTPIGYQTNLLVWAPGGYRWGDYLRMGLPLTAVTALTAILAIEWAFPY